MWETLRVCGGSIGLREGGPCTHSCSQPPEAASPRKNLLESHRDQTRSSPVKSDMWSASVELSLSEVEWCLGKALPLRGDGCSATSPNRHHLFPSAALQLRGFILGSAAGRVVVRTAATEQTPMGSSHPSLSNVIELGHWVSDTPPASWRGGELLWQLWLSCCPQGTSLVCRSPFPSVSWVPLRAPV